MQIAGLRASLSLLSVSVYERTMNLFGFYCCVGGPGDFVTTLHMAHGPKLVDRSFLLKSIRNNAKSEKAIPYSHPMATSSKGITGIKSPRRHKLYFPHFGDLPSLIQLKFGITCPTPLLYSSLFTPTTTTS